MSKECNYACHPEASRGRLFKEKEKRYRNCFQHDRDRIIHCGSFRKLENKTQVFASDFSDYARTRMTHCIEVAQIARAISVGLGLNSDLTEAAALAHDIGHTPFGHAGSDGLNTSVERYGVVFDHNIQALRIVTVVEEKYIEFKGLNLTMETLDCILKHNGPLERQTAQFTSIGPDIDLMNIKYDDFGPAEGRVAALSDGIAYSNHDIEDGFRYQLLTLEQLLDMPFFGMVLCQLLGKYKAKNARTIHVVCMAISKVIGKMVNDVIEESLRNIAHHKITHPEQMRESAVISFSPEMQDNVRKMKGFLASNMYGHHMLQRVSSLSQNITSKLFDFYFANPKCLPVEWQTKVSLSRSREEVVFTVCDFVSGMTDRYATNEYRKYIIGSVVV